MSRGKKNIQTTKAARRMVVKTNPARDSLESYLQMIASLKVTTRKDYKFANLETLIFKHGITFELSRAGNKAEMGQMGDCFMNAGKLALDNLDYQYCEGYAYTPTCPIAVLHAWCVDQDNTVVDPTWSDAKQCAYRGIIIPEQKLRQTLLSRKKWGVLDNPEERFPYLKNGIAANDSS